MVSRQPTKVYSTRATEETSSTNNQVTKLTSSSLNHNEWKRRLPSQKPSTLMYYYNRSNSIPPLHSSTPANASSNVPPPNNVNDYSNYFEEPTANHSWLMSDFASGSPPFAASNQPTVHPPAISTAGHHTMPYTQDENPCRQPKQRCTWVTRRDLPHDHTPGVLQQSSSTTPQQAFMPQTCISPHQTPTSNIALSRQIALQRPAPTHIRDIRMADTISNEKGSTISALNDSITPLLCKYTPLFEQQTSSYHSSVYGAEPSSSLMYTANSSTSNMEPPKKRFHPNDSLHPYPPLETSVEKSVSKLATTTCSSLNSQNPYLLQQKFQPTEISKQHVISPVQYNETQWYNNQPPHTWDDLLSSSHLWDDEERLNNGTLYSTQLLTNNSKPRFHNNSNMNQISDDIKNSDSNNDTNSSIHMNDHNNTTFNEEIAIASPVSISSPEGEEHGPYTFWKSKIQQRFDKNSVLRFVLIFKLSSLKFYYESNQLFEFTQMFLPLYSRSLRSETPPYMIEVFLRKSELDSQSLQKLLTSFQMHQLMPIALHLGSNPALGDEGLDILGLFLQKIQFPLRWLSFSKSGATNDAMRRFIKILLTRKDIYNDAYFLENNLSPLWLDFGSESNEALHLFLEMYYPGSSCSATNRMLCGVTRCAFPTTLIHLPKIVEVNNSADAVLHTAPVELSSCEQDDEQSDEISNNDDEFSELSSELNSKIHNEDLGSSGGLSEIISEEDEEEEENLFIEETLEQTNQGFPDKLPFISQNQEEQEKQTQEQQEEEYLIPNVSFSSEPDFSKEKNKTRNKLDLVNTNVPENPISSRVESRNGEKGDLTAAHRPSRERLYNNKQRLEREEDKSKRKGLSEKKKQANTKEMTTLPSSEIISSLNEVYRELLQDTFTLVSLIAVQHDIFPVDFLRDLMNVFIEGSSLESVSVPLLWELQSVQSLIKRISQEPAPSPALVSSLIQNKLGHILNENSSSHFVPLSGATIAAVADGLTHRRNHGHSKEIVTEVSSNNTLDESSGFVSVAHKQQHSHSKSHHNLDSQSFEAVVPDAVSETFSGRRCSRIPVEDSNMFIQAPRGAQSSEKHGEKEKQQQNKSTSSSRLKGKLYNNRKNINNLVILDDQLADIEEGEIALEVPNLGSKPLQIL